VLAIWHILKKGISGESYNISAGFEMRNIDLARLIIKRFAKLQNEDPQTLYSALAHIQDRPGHDFRYALCAQKLITMLGWQPRISFDKGLDQTIRWLLNLSK
jgi:dTDP-glucose 4,6-dehydratase